MGMFDYVTCEYELPEKPSHDSEGIWSNTKDIIFQTKSLDCVLGHFKIDAEGNLLKEARVYETDNAPLELDTSEDDKPFPFWKFPIRKLVSSTWDKSSFTGIVSFYESVEKPDETYDVSGWIEFDATFVNGTLQSIECVNNEGPRMYSAEERENIELMKAETAKIIQKQIDNTFVEIDKHKAVITQLTAASDQIAAICTQYLQPGVVDEDWLFEYLYNVNPESDDGYAAMVKQKLSEQLKRTF